MGNNKSQLVVAAIENGTVIDHIPAEKTYQVVNRKSAPVGEDGDSCYYRLQPAKQEDWQEGHHQGCQQVFYR